VSGGTAILLGALALIVSGCSTAGHPGSTATAPVLGQQSGTVSVTGQPAPPGTGELGAVACADAAHCVAVGVAGPNAATSGTTPSSSPDATVIVTSDDGGLAWTARPVSQVPPPALSGIDCPRVVDCIAVGSTGSYPPAGLVLTSRNGGTTWQQASSPAGAVDVTSVACSALDTCTAIVNDGTVTWSATSTDFGATWTRDGDLPAGFEDGRDLSCPTGLTCLVAGNTPTTTGHGQGAIVISTDGGVSWAESTVPTGLGLLQSATCASSITCLAVGTTSTTVSDVVPAQGELLVSDDGGQTWFPSPKGAPVQDVYGIACPSVKVCALVGTQWVGTPVTGTGAVGTTTDGGATFTAARTAYTPLTLTALACPTAQACVAVGGDTLARISLAAPSPAPVAAHRSTPANSV
jgi:photosystem II stability/assembly factor-like uncharacterized protein